MMRLTMMRLLLLPLIVLSMLISSACSMIPTDFEIEPWVKPYERQNMADPIMSPNRDPISSAYMHHVYQAREGARGAEGGGGGGCGCN